MSPNNSEEYSITYIPTAPPPPILQDLYISRHNTNEEFIEYQDHYHQKDNKQIFQIPKLKEYQT